jgi:ParB family chromosome partitioning protein
MTSQAPVMPPPPPPSPPATTTPSRPAVTAAAPVVVKMVKIADIKIGNRLRKKATNIESLAASIADIGLLHPPVIDGNNNLIAGFRRIKAYEHLGRTEIPFTRVNISNAMQGEYDENVERADFALEDIAAIYKEVQKTRIGHRPKKGVDSTPFLLPFPKGKSREVTAKIAGYGPDKVRKIVELVNAAKENPDKKLDLGYDTRTYAELVSGVDNHKIPLHKAYSRYKRNERIIKLREETAAAAEALERSGKVTTTEIRNGVAITFHDLPPYTPPPEPEPSPELLRAQEIEQELLEDRGRFDDIMKLEIASYNERDGAFEVHQPDLDMTSLEKLIKLCKELGMNFMIKPCVSWYVGERAVTVKFSKEAEVVART